MLPLTCRVCENDHKYVCNCGCPHDEHTPGGGCTNHKKCDIYDQSMQRLPYETQELFDARVLKIHTKELKIKRRIRRRIYA